MTHAASPVVRWRLARAVLLVALLAAAALGCAPGAEGARPEREITSATPIGDVFAPRFEVDAAASAIERFDPPGAGAGLVLAVESTVRNPNAFPIVLQRVDYRLQVAGDSVASGSRAFDLPLDPGETRAVSWRFDADLSDRPRLWSAVVGAFAGTPLAFELDGRVVFASQSYSFTTGARDLMGGGVLARQNVVAPRLRLDGIGSRLTVVRADAPAVTVVLVATNPGDVGYFLSGSDVVLELNGAPVATIELAPYPLAAGETVRRELVFLVDVARLEPSARAALDEALAGARGDVRLRGALAYDVLGVDSFRIDPSDLSVSIPSRALPTPPAVTDDVPADDGAPAHDEAPTPDAPAPDDDATDTP